MAHWQSTLEVSDVWPKAHAGEMSIQELAGVVADRIGTQLQHWSGDTDLQVIRGCFCAVQADENATVEEFDEVLDDLYYWADDGHRCWVNTIPRAKG